VAFSSLNSTTFDMMLKLAALLLVCLTAVVVSQTTEEKLAAVLFKDYNKNVSPHSTPLNMALSYMCANINKANLQLTSRLLEKYTWEDSRLKWDPKSYEGITHLRYPARHLWTPDFKLYNSPYEAETRDEVNSVIFNNGTVLWIPIATYKTACAPLRRNTFSCQLKLGSWTYSANTIGMKLSGTGFDKVMYLDACPYDIVEPQIKVENVTYPCCPEEPYGTMTVNFLLHDRV